MITNQTQFVLLMVAIGAGFIVGAALAWWLAGRNKSEPVDEEQEALKDLRKRYIEKAALWQERSSGQLVVRSAGQMISSPADLSEAQKKNMNSLLMDWVGWLGYRGSHNETAQPMQQPQEEKVLITPAPDVPAPVVERAESVDGNKPKKPAAEKPKSIVEQINDVLQESLKSHPALSKGIRLTEDPRSGVVVWVGLEHYLGVDAVPDPQVKQILKEAVKEWERRTQPGK